MEILCPTVSAATTVIGKDIRYSWEGDDLTQDVAHWVSGEFNNFGWILVGDESEILTAKRFNSRENPNVESRPHLTINFLRPTEITGSSPMADGSVAVSFTTYQAKITRSNRAQSSHRGTRCHQWQVMARK